MKYISYLKGMRYLSFLYLIPFFYFIPLAFNIQPTETLTVVILVFLTVLCLVFGIMGLIQLVRNYDCKLLSVLTLISLLFYVFLIGVFVFPQVLERSASIHMIGSIISFFMMYAPFLIYPLTTILIARMSKNQIRIPAIVFAVLAVVWKINGFLQAFLYDDAVVSDSYVNPWYLHDALILGEHAVMVIIGIYLILALWYSSILVEEPN